MVTTRERDRDQGRWWSNVAAIRAVATADFRSHRRRPVVWLLVLLALAVTLAAAHYHAYLHEARSYHMPIVGFFWPPFRLAEYGGYLVLVLAVGCCLLGFDARQRDANASIEEAFECRPMSNLAVLLGRLVAIIGATWLPCTLLLALHELLANVAHPLGFDGPVFGEAPLLRLLFFDTLPAVIFWSAVVMLLASAFRDRSLTLGVSLALVAFHVWGVANVPHYLLETVTTFPDNSSLASDIAPGNVALRELLQRLALVSAAAGCIVAAARFYPRNDGVSRRLQAWTALGFGTIGVVGIAWIGTLATQELGERDRWAAKQRDMANDAHHTPNIEKVVGAIQIDPQGALAIDIAVETAPVPPTVRALVFTFNPGMIVEALFLDGHAGEFTHEDGGLVVTLPNASTASDGIVIRLIATGIPDSSFAFPDGVFDPDRLPASSRVELLGTDASLYQSDYVALMPSVYWLPVSGPTVQNGLVDRHDIFEIDLNVSVPDGWLAVGPGERTLVQTGPPVYRVHTRNAVPGVALFAGPFQSYTAQIDDLDVELALHPKHLENAQLYSPVSGSLMAELAELLAFADANGIPYPHEALRIVEVPTRLRTYGRGSLMQPLGAGSGVLFLREAGWPTARFLREEGDIMAGQLRVFVLNDRVSDLHDGLARNILERTRAAGDGAEALDFVLHRLTRLTLTQSPWVTNRR